MEAAARAHREYVPASPSAASSAPASMDQDLDSPSHGPGPEQAHEPSGADPSQEGGAAPAPQDAAPTARGAVCPVLPPPAIPTHSTPPDSPRPIILGDGDIGDGLLVTDWDAEDIVAAARQLGTTITLWRLVCSTIRGKRPRPQPWRGTTANPADHQTGRQWPAVGDAWVVDLPPAEHGWRGTFLRRWPLSLDLGNPLAITSHRMAD